MHFDSMGPISYTWTKYNTLLSHDTTLDHLYVRGNFYSFFLEKKSLNLAGGPSCHMRKVVKSYVFE
jgi:hypothetical protein